MTSSGIRTSNRCAVRANGGTSDPEDVDDVVDDLKVLKWPARSPADPCASCPPDNYGASANHAHDHAVSNEYGSRHRIGTQN
jgi:hypothetical protein